MLQEPKAFAVLAILLTNTVPLNNFIFISLVCHVLEKVRSSLYEPGLSPVYAQSYFALWFISESVQCCCLCSDK